MFRSSPRHRSFATWFVLAALVAGLMATSFVMAQTRDVMRVGVQNLPPTLDPQSHVSLTGSRVYYNVFDTLIRMDPYDNSILEPQLALSWERLSDTVLELRLRPGVVFHNGDKFTSADVKFSLERVLDPEAPFANARGLLSVIDRVETPDELTVHVITRAPDAVIVYRLASLWGGWMLPEGYIREVGDEAFGRTPIGTGPFKVVEYRPDLVVLEAFDEYWDEQPNVRQVRFQVIPESSGRITALVNNEVAIINPVLPDQVETLQSFDNVEVMCLEHQLIHLLVFNTANPVMADERLRQAVSLAIDRDLIVETLWGEGAGSTRGFQFPDYGDLFLEDRPFTPYDPERAMELIAESGYAGETLYYDLIPGYYDNDIEAAEVIVEMLRAVGINAQIRPQTAFWANDDRAIHPWSYAARFPDPVGGLWLLFGEFSSRQATGVNDFVDVDPRFNELGHQLAAEQDTAVRQEIFREMLDIWERQSPGTTLWRPALCTGVSSSLDWAMHPSHTMDFRAVNLRFED